VEAVQVIEELIALAKEMRQADRRGEQLGLSEEELAFYDALETNDSAVKVLGEPTLKRIARELVETVRRNVTVDWAERENVRAHLRRLVKRVLRKYGYLAGQAGEGYADRPGAGGGAFCRMGGGMNRASNDQGAPVGTSDSRTNHWSYDAALGCVPHSTHRSVVSQPRRTPHQLRLGTP
jgi:hypothetical protein